MFELFLKYAKSLLTSPFFAAPYLELRNPIVVLVLFSNRATSALFIHQLILRILVLFMALAPTLMVRAPAPEVPRMKSSMPFFQSLYNSKTQIAQIPALTTWMFHMDSHITKTLGDFANRLAEMKQNFSTSLHVCAKSRHMLHQHQIYQVRQDPGLHANKLTAPQLLGPMAQDHLVTIRTRDADLMFP